MTTRTLAGLQWRAISPSFYELAAYPKIDISFVGDVWYLPNYIVYNTTAICCVGRAREGLTDE